MRSMFGVNSRKQVVGYRTNLVLLANWCLYHRLGIWGLVALVITKQVIKVTQNQCKIDSSDQ